MPTLQQVADFLGVPCSTHGDRQLSGLNTLEHATSNDLSILGSDRYVNEYKVTKAGAVLVGKKVKFAPRDEVPTLIVDNADLAMAKMLDHLAPPNAHPIIGTNANAIIDPTASVGEGASIGPNVFIGARTAIGMNVVLYPGVYISDDVTIGDNCVLYPNVVIRERIVIGNRVVINAGSVIGTDGFGYRWDGRQHAKIPHIGTVVIEDDVEIGSCSCVDRAKFSETRIGRGTKIDNLVQIGHNVTVGMFNILCAHSGIAGTATTGNGVVLGGASAVADHVHISDGVIAGGHTLFISDVEKGTVVSGWPAMPHRQWLRHLANRERMGEMFNEVKRLRAEVDELKKKA